MEERSRDETSRKRRSHESASETVPPKKPAIGFNLKISSTTKSSSKHKLMKPGSMKLVKKPVQNAVAMKLANDQKTEPTVLKKSSKVAAIFNEDSDSEPEEIPPEARMRMKNIGRGTPTSSGPNSFNKGKLGFSDSQRMWEQKQQEIARKNEKK